MKFIAALEIVFWLLVLYTLARQVIVPLWNGEKIFPVLRRRRDLEVNLRDAQTHLNDQEVINKIEAVKSKIKSTTNRK